MTSSALRTGSLEKIRYASSADVGNETAKTETVDHKERDVEKKEHRERKKDVSREEKSRRTLDGR